MRLAAPLIARSYRQSRLDSGARRSDMRCKDRLPDLRRRVADAGSAVSESAPAHPPHLAEILHQALCIRGWIQQVAADTARARTLLADPAFHTSKNLQEQLDATVTSCNAAGLKVCGALRQLEAAGGAAGAAGRIARLQAHCARRRYSAALGAHHALLAAARDTQLRLLRHHANIMNLPLSEEEAEGLLDSDNIALFVDNVRAETAEARLALREAEARHAELRRAEAALCDVRDLFRQLAALVAQQQDQLDTVAHFALQATADVDQGQKQLLKGSVTRRRTRKKKLGLIVCLASGFLVVLLVLIFT